MTSSTWKDWRAIRVFLVTCNPLRSFHGVALPKSCGSEVLWLSTCARMHLGLGVLKNCSLELEFWHCWVSLNSAVRLWCTLWRLQTMKKETCWHSMQSCLIMRARRPGRCGCFWLYRAPPCPAVVLTAPSIGKPIQSLQELVLAVCFCDPRTFAVQALSFLWTSCVWDWTVCKSIQILRSPARKQYYLNIPFWSSNHRRTSELTHRHCPSIKSRCSKMKILGWGRKEAESWSFWECGAGYAEWTEWTSWFMDILWW